MSSQGFLKLGRLLAISAPLILAACHTAGPLPSGYAYHSDMYKSPPAAKPQAIGYPYTEQKNAESAAHWRMAAEDMVERLTAKHGIPPVPVYVAPDVPDSPFQASFDNFLREAMINKGFAIASRKDPAAPVVHYEATIVEHKGMRDNNLRSDSAYAYNDGDYMMPAPGLPATNKEVVLSVTITSGAGIVAEETGVYYIPEADEYQYKPAILRNMQVVGEGQ